MRLIIKPNYDYMSKWTANYVAKRIKEANPTGEKLFVLGCPTGSSPLGLYDELIRKYEMGELSFRNVVTFNMDEYVGLDESNPQSFHSFMWNNFFSHIDIRKENVHILNGNADNIYKECSEYEMSIRSAGGVDLFLCGMGTDGHIAFNEPGSSLVSRTRQKTLTTETRISNSHFFGNNVDMVPYSALTVGVGTVMDAHEVVVMVSGHSKARALHNAIEGGINQMCTASALQLHPHVVIVCDEAACGELKVDTYRYFKDIEKDNNLL